MIYEHTIHRWGDEMNKTRVYIIYNKVIDYLRTLKCVQRLSEVTGCSQDAIQGRF